jgi:2-polyprenyl-3-methyl-5-hydroxy-6-metoxy-1,4-benzoquinol methylase
VSIFGALDVPVAEATIAREGFVITGFAFDEASGPFTHVSVLCDGLEIGTTKLRHRRIDVPAALPKVWDATCGFRLLATLPPNGATKHTIEVRATFKDGTSWVQERSIAAGPADYRKGPYGGLLFEGATTVYGRHDIYSVGPPAPDASIECVALLDSYLAPGECVLDIGCGIGAYAPPLLSAGIAWQGCEVNVDFVHQLRERGLPVTLVEGDTLPFENGAFKTAICIEVLEHIADYQAFLVEVARVTGERAFFSVPNVEAIAVLTDQLVIPFHMLEADHKHFFTREGLRATLERHFRHVEVIPYGVMPLQSSNGTPVHYHLFATAEH